MKAYILSLLVLLPGLIIPASAQDAPICGTPVPTLRPVSNFELMRRVAPRLADINATYAINLHIYVLADDNGSDLACSEDDVIANVRYASELLNPYGFCLVITRIEFLNSSFINTMNTSHAGRVDRLRELASSTAVTLFYHDELFSNDGGLNGSAYDIPNHFLSVVGSQATETSTTLAHELGHCLGLLHTFEDHYGEENVARSGNCKNCEETGDLLCDTQADRTGINITFNTNCEYSGSETRDACNEVILFEPTNIMTYGRRTCRTELTPGQVERMKATINTDLFTDRIAPANLTITNAVVNSGVTTRSARESLNFVPTTSFQVRGTAQYFGIGKTINLSPGVVLMPGQNGMVSFKPESFCD